MSISLSGWQAAGSWGWAAQGLRRVFGAGGTDPAEADAQQRHHQILEEGYACRGRLQGLPRGRDGKNDVSQEVVDGGHLPGDSVTQAWRGTKSVLRAVGHGAFGV